MVLRNQGQKVDSCSHISHPLNHSHLLIKPKGVNSCQLYPGMRFIFPYKRVLSSAAASKLSNEHEKRNWQRGNVVWQKIQFLSCWLLTFLLVDCWSAGEPDKDAGLPLHPPPPPSCLKYLAGQKALPEWPGNGCGGEEAAWLQAGERNSRKRFLKKPLMNSSSGNGFNGFNGSLGTTVSQASTYLCTRTTPPLSTKYKVKCFLTLMKTIPK